MSFAELTENDFDFDTPTAVGPFIVEIKNEIGAENPFDIGEATCPMLCKSWDFNNLHLEEYNDFDYSCLITPEACRKNYSILYKLLSPYSCILLDGDFIEILNIGRDYRTEKVFNFRNELVELVIDALNSVKEQGDLDCFHEVLKIFGYQTLLTSGKGYCQGDYIELLFVATPNWIEESGLSKTLDITKDLEQQAKIFTAWAFGDTWRYTIENTDGDTLESVGGFYGAFACANSGILEHINHDLRYLLRSHEEATNCAYSLPLVVAA